MTSLVHPFLKWIRRYTKKALGLTQQAVSEKMSDLAELLKLAKLSTGIVFPTWEKWAGRPTLSDY